MIEQLNGMHLDNFERCILAIHFRFSFDFYILKFFLLGFLLQFLGKYLECLKFILQNSLIFGNKMLLKMIYLEHSEIS